VRAGGVVVGGWVDVRRSMAKHICRCVREGTWNVDVG
jgi:hypothetical protein